MKYSSKNCPICKKNKKKIIFKYFSKPKTETIFNNLNYKNYYRHYYKCESCENYSSFNEVRVPYAMKLFIQELESMSIAPRLLTK